MFSSAPLLYSIFKMESDKTATSRRTRGARKKSSKPWGRKRDREIDEFINKKRW